VDALNARSRVERQQVLERNRNNVFEHLYDLINDIKNDLFSIIPIDKAYISIDSVFPNNEKYFWHTHQIAEYATAHDYYFNRHLPRGWFKISFSISDNKRYDLVTTVHHFGFDDSVIAVGAFLEFTEHIRTENEEKVTIPINLKPFTISLEGDTGARLSNLSHYV